MSSSANASADEYVGKNRDLWDKRVRAHLRDGLYPSAKVEAGTYEVGLPDRVDVGDVAGMRLLHLQCNAGADTLFFARKGASVVGVDFSEEAIVEARRLADATGLEAQFVCSDIYALPALGLGRFDVIYTSMGVLWWLPDLAGWAELIADHLNPDGFSYIHEIHPLASVFDADEGKLVAAHDYFGIGEPLTFETTGTYYDAPDFAAEPATECGWVHTLAEVVTSLAAVGLQIEYLREYATTGFRMLPSLERDGDGHWTTPPGTARVPLTFSLRAFPAPRPC